MRDECIKGIIDLNKRGVIPFDLESMLCNPCEEFGMQGTVFFKGNFRIDDLEMPTVELNMSISDFDDKYLILHAYTVKGRSMSSFHLRALCDRVSEFSFYDSIFVTSNDADAELVMYLDSVFSERIDTLFGLFASSSYLYSSSARPLRPDDELYGRISAPRI
jgi:uncharacterized protein (DUF1778 family)